MFWFGPKNFRPPRTQKTHFRGRRNFGQNRFLVENRDFRHFVSLVYEKGVGARKKIFSRVVSFWKNNRKGPGMSIYTQMTHLKFSTILGKILIFSHFSWVQKFQPAKIWVRGAGWAKIFRPMQKTSKRFPKKIFMSIGRFEPTVGFSKCLAFPSKREDFRVTRGYFSETFWHV